jgi:FtsP/CotA-like multicopper oxidase with cupredoxin domain
MTPGPTFHARYGEPVFLRRYNNLPPSQLGFGLNSTTIHLHNAHTASESDGNPLDYKDSGRFWDHHYANIRAGYDQFGGNGDVRETMTTLWYHDHRMDFTAANVYAGLTGFYLLFDERDTGNENDPDREAFRLPSGRYDVPLILHDVQFDENGQVFFDIFNTDGFLGDKWTVNRTIQPFFKVEARKYRFRILNGGPSRFYKLFLSTNQKFIQLSNDGNMLPAPLAVESIDLSVAERVDVIIDFSRYRPGTQLYLLNRLEQTNGRGPTGKLLDPGDQILRFDVVQPTGPDNSRIPDTLRELPPIDLSEVAQERLWRFDYDGGLWTVNGKPFEMDRIDAEIKQGAAEIWTIRNEGTSWAHPVHIHFEEFQILERNGKPIPKNHVDKSRKDVLRLMPNDEVKIFMRFRDFLGRYVMHCHNVVHEDHSMMIQWVIVP